MQTRRSICRAIVLAWLSLAATSQAYAQCIVDADCADGNVCNGVETCPAGTCVPGTALTCNDSNPCTDDTCNTTTGCVYTNDDTNSCSDGNACNGAETCSLGACVPGTALTCNDSNPCTDDTCSPATGCVYTNDDTNVCADANLCNGTETCSAGA
ncbi:MAG: hypothetical protein AABZ12_09935, partial [Planctomycetota bacterium]